MIAAWLAVAVAAPLHADRPQPQLQWHTLQTEHFRIHFPKSRRADAIHPVDAEGTARRVAAVADDLWLRIADHTGWFPRSTLHVLVVDDADQLTAFSLPHWGWIVLSAHPGVEVHRLRGRSDWVSDSLGHELSHVFAHELSGALAQVASGGIEATGVVEAGPVAASVQGVLAPNEPYWWSEGTAELWAERAGVNHWSTGRDATLRLSVLEDRLLTWEEWAVAADKGDHGDAERVYQQGYAFGRWLDAEYGEDVLLRLGWAARDRYRPAWSASLEAVVGEAPRVVYGRFRAATTSHYGGQLARIRARGVVEGVELERWEGPWTSTDLGARDRWLQRTPRDREETRESTGSWELYPRMSPDGRWLAEGRVGWLRVQRVTEDLYPALTGARPDHAALVASEALARDTTAWLPAALGSAPAFLPGQDTLIVAAPIGTEHPSPARPDLGAVSWNQLYRVDLSPRVRPWRRSLTGERQTLPDGRVSVRRRYEPIPDTERALDPAVSPDGSWLAFVQVRDGTANLVVSRPDGSERRELSSFDDGTWLRGPAWSPDGAALVVSMLRTDRPDLWQVDVASGAWTALTGDAHDEQDPVWTDAGIWFSSDPDGVFNIYRLDPASGRITQVTNVVGGAHTPWVTPRGHLLYSGRTATGFKSVGLRADEQAGWEATDAFVLDVSPRDAARDLAFRPSLPDLPARRYRPVGQVLSPVVAPLLRVDATEGTATPLGGAWIRVRDAVEVHELTLEGLAGEDLLGQGRWVWRRFLPELALWAAGASDRRLATVDGARVQRRNLGAVGASADLPWRDGVRLRAEVLALQLGVGEGGTSAPRLQSLRTGVSLRLGDAPSRSSEPARTVTLGWTHAWSEAAPGGLGAVDDGALLDRYAWDRLVVDGALSLPLALSTGATWEHRHRVELDWTAGWTSRNVLSDEELRAGGPVPGALRPAVVEGSAPLPGFAPFVVSGETLLVGGAGWVIPVAPRLRAGGSALYLESLHTVIGADVGNAWSYADGRVERPLLDVPSDHGHPVLVDVRAEARLAAILADTPWDSFVRFAWGLQDLGALPPGGPIAGDAGRPSGGPRLTVGVGTGW